MEEKKEYGADSTPKPSDADVLRELDARLDAVAAVMEELAVNQQTLAARCGRGDADPPILNTRNTGLYISSGGAAGALTQLLQSRRTFTLFAKCCQKTCSFTL